MFAIGVTLCVAPIFSLARAQQSTTESRLLLELQALRAEVAELRDMVERQQYQLRRMQQQAAERPSSPSPGVARPAEPVKQPVARVPDPQYSPPTPAPSGQIDEQAASETDKQAATASSSDLPDDFYRPGTEQAPKEVVSATTSRADPAPTSGTDSRFPPVEERSVGVSTGTQPAITGSAPSAGSSSSPATPVDLEPPSVLDPPPPVTESVSEKEEPEANQVSAVAAAPVIAVPPSVQDPSSTANPVPANMPVSAPPIASSANASVPAVLPEDEYYEQGFDLVKQGKFADAIQIFQELIKRYPQGDLVGDAHYWIGESSFLDRDLDTSKKYFKTFIEGYPQSARLPGAMLRTAYIEQEQGNQMEARILLNEIIQYYPRSDAVHAARNRLAELQGQVN